MIQQENIVTESATIPTIKKRRSALRHFAKSLCNFTKRKTKNVPLAFAYWTCGYLKNKGVSPIHL